VKFLANGMLGNISRWLRLLGYDVEYAPVKDDTELIRRSMVEERILLTADVELFRLAKRRGVKAILVKETSTVQSLSRLSKKLKLPLIFNQMRSRCPTCGSILARVAKDSVEGKIPKRTYQTYNRFWICTSSSCSKVYWRGSHWRKIKETLEKARE
jgi:uncharacterized protein with PIN domain